MRFEQENMRENAVHTLISTSVCSEPSIHFTRYFFMTIAKHNWQWILYTWPGLHFTSYIYHDICQAQYAVNIVHLAESAFYKVFFSWHLPSTICSKYCILSRACTLPGIFSLQLPSKICSKCCIFSRACLLLGIFSWQLPYTICSKYCILSRACTLPGIFSWPLPSKIWSKYCILSQACTLPITWRERRHFFL